jgi:uncharacterized protein
MRCKVKEIGPDGLALDLPVTPDWLARECPDLEARPGPGGVSLRCIIQKSGEDYLLRGALRGEMEMACSRCLEPAHLALDVPLTVTFVEREANGEEDEADDDLDVVFFEGGEIDLGTEVRDELLLAMPINTVCQETCRGLCPVCGGNRNENPCHCEEKQRQGISKLAALGKIKL